MKYLKYVVPVLIAIGLPLLFQTSKSYVFLNSFPYGSYVHLSVAIALYIFKILLLIGIAGLIIGLIKPNLAYFSSTPNRANITIYYSFLLFLAFIVHKEMNFLGESTSKIKKPALTDFYNEITPGEQTKSLISKIEKFRYELQWWGGDSSSFSRVEGFPYKKSNQLILQINFPGLSESNLIVVEISEKFDHEKSIILRKTLIEEDRTIASSPELKNEDARIIFGTFKSIDGKRIFFPCRSSHSFEANFSHINQKHAFMFNDNEIYEKEGLFAIFSGSYSNEKSCDNCSENSDTLYVYDGFESQSANSFSPENYYCKNKKDKKNERDEIKKILLKKIKN